FPDPDLPPLVLTPQWIQAVQAEMPELPSQKRSRFEAELGLSPYDAAQLTMHRQVADYFQDTADALPQGQAKLAANWILGELSAALNRDGLDIQASPIAPVQLAALLVRIVDGTISNKIARDVFTAMWSGESGGAPDAIIEARGLKQISDSGAIAAMVDEVLAAHPAIVEEYRAGKQKAFNSLVGQVMKAARGKANPQQVNTLLLEKLRSSAD
ncbi:MAG TPA: Asp-tRNA(Asn)/Glu-tRNA(Gln) amidotransferase GatCAB subunit B, partial [Castellaniella sp.]|nr:Asp-tRNA(Asn)/Glu-tRNA(Gln) amidotransferase GatCAB subunit B [Castellaniella sp.]